MPFSKQDPNPYISSYHNSRIFRIKPAVSEQLHLYLLNFPTCHPYVHNMPLTDIFPPFPDISLSLCFSLFLSLSLPPTFPNHNCFSCMGQGFRALLSLYWIFTRSAVQKTTTKKTLRNFKEHTKNPSSIVEITLYIQLHFQHMVSLNPYLIPLRPSEQRTQTHVAFPSLL